MLNPRYFLVNVIILILGAASAHAAGEILRNADGSIKHMDQYNAMSACPTGTRLPTIRELAQESLDRGAKSLVEASEMEADFHEVPPINYKVSAINPDGLKDEFYFNYIGYGPNGDGDLVINTFWSSSVFSHNSGDAYVLRGYLGDIYHYQRANPYFAVLCVPSH